MWCRDTRVRNSILSFFGRYNRGGGAVSATMASLETQNVMRFEMQNTNSGYLFLHYNNVLASAWILCIDKHWRLRIDTSFANKYAHVTNRTTYTFLLRACANGLRSHKLTPLWFNCRRSVICRSLFYCRAWELSMSGSPKEWWSSLPDTNGICTWGDRCRLTIVVVYEN